MKNFFRRYVAEPFDKVISRFSSSYRTLDADRRRLLGLSQRQFDSLHEERKYSKTLEGTVEVQRGELEALTKKVGSQKGYMGHLKIERRKLLHDIKELARDGLAYVNYLVGIGVNPLTQERENRYAFVDTRGKVTSVSEELQKILGADSENWDYRNLLTREALEKVRSIGEDESFELLPINVVYNGKQRSFALKGVKITHIPYLGYLIDFERIARYNEWTERVVKRREKAVEDVKKTIEKMNKRAQDLLRGRDEESGTEMV